jgi:hypothetical protein
MDYPHPGSEALPQGVWHLTQRLTQSQPDTTAVHPHNFIRLPRFPYDQATFFVAPAVQNHVSIALLHLGLNERMPSAPAQGQTAPVVLSHQPTTPDGHNSNGVGVQPMGPPPKSRKRKAPTLREDDWEPVKARVIELHVTQNLPLPEVKKIVEDELKSRGFTAT